MRCWLMHVNVKCHFSCKRVVGHIFARVLWTRWTATALMSRQQKQPRSTPNLAANNVRMINVTLHMKEFDWLTSALWRWLQKTKISRFSGSSFYYFPVFENQTVRGSEATGFFMVAKKKVQKKRKKKNKKRTSSDLRLHICSSASMCSKRTPECHPARLCCNDVALTAPTTSTPPFTKKDWRMQRITTAHPKPFTHKHTHFSRPAPPFGTFFLTLGADTRRPEHVGAFYAVLNPKARLCAKNSTATIGIINIAVRSPYTLPARCSATKAMGFKNTNSFNTRNRAKTRVK